jgi:malonyl-ACP decarboxylase
MASAEAWTEAGLIGEGHDARRQGVVVAGHDLAMGYEQGLRAKFDVSPHHLPPSFAVHMMDTDHVGALSEALSIEGYGMTVGGASASGTMALIEGAELIASGRIDQCLVVGPMADLSAMAIQAFDAIGALGGVAHGGHEASRPFDRGRDGFIFGQAVGALVLERGSLARKRGATVFGRILGTGVALDASAAPAPSAEGEARAMRQALQEAGLEPDAIDTINAHGTSSKAGDGVELEAIHSVFGEHTKSLRVQSTKGLIGHTLWAAGVIEALALLVQMQGGFVHPNANLMEPIRDDRGLVGGEAMTPGPTVAMSNSFGFGGINTSLVIACGDERGAP